MEFKTGYIPHEIYEVRTVGRQGTAFKLFDVKGNKVGTLGVNTSTRKKAYEAGQALQAYVQENGKKVYRRVPMETMMHMKANPAPLHTTEGETITEQPKTHQEVVDYIHNEAVGIRPEELFMSDLKWKHLVRSAVRGKNIMMTGPAGCGKTMAAKALVKGLQRPDFYFNLGATQDPRATLIGNTHFNNGSGTYFDESLFVKAIKTPNAVILLDEFTRAHPEAHNILMTVLDQGQRYLRLDEADGSPTIKVANGVTFIATANIGTDYTGTRIMDRAIKDRFTFIEMDVLGVKEETDLLTMLFPNVEKRILKAIAETSNHTRLSAKDDSIDMETMISTRASVEWAELIYDGFTFVEAAELAILPFFNDDGGTDSEKTQVLQFIQKYDFSTPEVTEDKKVEFEVGEEDDDDELIF